MARSFHYDLSPFIEMVTKRIPLHEVSPGKYRRHLRPASDHTPSDAAVPADAYGTAGAVNLLYTLGELPPSASRRAELVAGLRSFQDAKSGIFVDSTHSDTHTTAHCTAALQLFDELPNYPLSYLRPLVTEPGALENFLDQLDWDTPWQASHDGAGIFAALVLAGEANDEWIERYFRWLDSEVSSDTGLWRQHRLQAIEQQPGLFGNLAGTFHYHFNYIYAKWALPYPERVIDSCLQLLENSPVDIALKFVEFKDIDWVFCINRAARASGYRRSEVLAALQTVCERVVRKLSDDDYLESNHFDDLHKIFGAVCTVAELQLALPNSIHTPRPLTLVLDRRPFI